MDILKHLLNAILVVGNLELSWDKGSDNLRYYVDIKVDGVTDDWINKVLNLGTSTSFQFNENYFDKLGEILGTSLGIYGTYHYRVRYLNPYNKDCEGFLPEGQFSYVVKTDDLTVILNHFNAFGESYKIFNKNDINKVNSIQEITSYYYNDGNEDTDDKILRLYYEMKNGLEYYWEIESLRSNNIYTLGELIGLSGVIDNSLTVDGWSANCTGVNFRRYSIEDGWISWKVKARAIGDKSCECEFVDGPVNYNTNEKQDICYSEMIPFGYRSSDYYGHSAVIDTNGEITIHNLNDAPFQHRLLLARDRNVLSSIDNNIDYSKIVKICDWNTPNSNVIDFESTCGALDIDDEVYFLVETRLDENSCGGAIGYSVWSQTRSVLGIFRAFSGYYICDLVDESCVM